MVTGVASAAHSGRPSLKHLGRWLGRHPGAARFGVVVVLFVIWEVTARQFVDPRFFSPPSRVLASLGAVLGTKGVPEALRVTFYELAAAFTIAVLIGGLLGLGLGLGRFANRSLMPIVLLLYGTPQITILPIFVLLFGIGPASKIAFGVTHGIFPVTILVAAGVQNLKPIYLVSARSMGASRWHILRYVIFPHVIPTFFTSMRLAMTGVLLGVLLAELYVSIAGIGYFTTLFTQDFDSAKLIGLVSILAAMAVVLNELMRRAELHYCKWRS